MTRGYVFYCSLGAHQLCHFFCVICARSVRAGLAAVAPPTSPPSSAVVLDLSCISGAYMLSVAVRAAFIRERRPSFTHNRAQPWTDSLSVHLCCALPF